MEKKYVWMIKEKDWPYGKYLSVSYNADDLKKMTEALNEAGWVNTIVSPRKEVSEKGVSHSSYILEKSDKPKRKVDDEEITIDNIPF